MATATVAHHETEVHEHHDHHDHTDELARMRQLAAIQTLSDDEVFDD